MGWYPIVMIEEPTLDGHGHVGDDDEDDSMLVDEEEPGLRNTLFGAWRNVMWRTVSLFTLCRLRFVSGGRLVDSCKVKFQGVLERSQASRSLVSYVCP